MNMAMRQQPRSIPRLTTTAEEGNNDEMKRNIAVSVLR